MGIYVFGSNMFGQLGVSSEETPNTSAPLWLSFFDTKTVKKIAAGKIHALALCEGNELYSWGLNDDKALGRATENDEESEVPGRVPFHHEIADICAGSCYSAVLTMARRIFICGTFKSVGGNLGISPESLKYNELQEMKGLKDIKHINGGDNHIIAVTKNGSVYTCGANESLQLGRVCRPRKKNRSLEPSSISNALQKGSKPIFGVDGGMAHSFGWDIENECFGWGSNSHGQLGNGMDRDSVFSKIPVMKDVVKVVCGLNHTLFLTKDKKVYGCGDNSESQLGVGDEKEIYSPVVIFENADDISAGGCNTIIRRGNKLFSSGFNYYGECGHEEAFVKNFTEIPFDFGEIIDVKCGLNFTMVLTK